MLVTCTCDAENRNFLIVLVVVESKNNDSLGWFLVQLWDETVDMEHDVVSVSNRQKGLVDAVSFD